MRALLSILAVLFFAASGFMAEPAQATELAPPSAASFVPRLDRILLRDVLRASGVTEEEKRRIHEESFQALLEEVSREVGQVRSSYRRARKLHDLLHQRVLRRYESTADGLDSILERGEYNCLSASLLYGLLGRALGLEVQVVEIPRHVYVRFLIEQRRVEVESTARNGFDLRPRFATAQGHPLVDPGYGSDANASPLSPPEPVPESVDLERAVGFLWHNQGRRALERGNALIAAESFLEESKLEPLEASRSETLGMYLARAFRMDYEAGSFESAYRIAEIGMEIFPGQTTARDRLLAAALKRIEAACEVGRTEAAEGILDHATSTSKNPVNTRRLERGACPLIAAAAVRAEEWDRAERMTLRFSAAEPDGVESRRLAGWVARRRQEANVRSAENACAEPAEGSFPSPFLSMLGNSTGAD
ncbi:MAG TPA: transglutaminase family protein [Candidatus Polarisedimenticolia bacterium]|jgi:hypothetical protein|nr:transglutaminase family protein [Candidatus Polarisedimenticolia bacterium]